MRLVTWEVSPAGLDLRLHSFCHLIRGLDITSGDAVVGWREVWVQERGLAAVGHPGGAASPREQRQSCKSGGSRSGCHGWFPKMSVHVGFLTSLLHPEGRLSPSTHVCTHTRQHYMFFSCCYQGHVRHWGALLTPGRVAELSFGTCLMPL